MSIFRNQSVMTAMGGNPQYYENRPSSVPAIDAITPAPPTANGAEGEPQPTLRFPEQMTSGFYEDEAHEFHISYGYRAQPDLGGALNYAYENYGLPLNDVAGPFMVAKWPITPIGSRPLAFYQMSPETSLGGLVPGQFISQPLLNPMDLGSGYDIYD